MLLVNVARDLPSFPTRRSSDLGGGEVTTTNDAASDPTTIGPGPDFTITKTHVGNFKQKKKAPTYTITVNNDAAGGAQAGNTVTVTDTMPPSGLTATSISGSGWS